MPQVASSPDTQAASGGMTVAEGANVFASMLSAEAEDPQDRELPTASAPAEAAPDAPEIADEPESTPADADEEGDDGPESERDEESEATDPEPAAPRTFRVKTADGEAEVTEDEVVKGYLRQSDYTRKTQELSKHRSEVTAAREQYLAGLQQIHTALQQLEPQEPNWEELRRSDPQRYALEYADWTRMQDSRRQIEYEHAQTLQQHQAEQGQALQEARMVEQQKLAEAIPAWKNAEVAKREKTDLVTYAKQQGYTDEMIAGIQDHRVFVLLRKAMLFDRAQSAPKTAPKATPATPSAPAPKTIQPGTLATQKKPVSDETRARQALAKTGSRADAASVFLHHLRTERK
jgi:hypothetical protein